MTTDYKNSGLRYYIINGTTGLTIFKVELGDIDRFESAYSDRVIARGTSLADVLCSTRWADKIPLELLEGKTPVDENNTPLL